jgi:molybdopterin-guanine dinucleotide biosynthesis protein A
MGRNKALVEIDGVPMAARVVAALRVSGCSPVVAIGGRADELAVLDVAVVPDDHPGQGPLGGIATALRTAGSVDVMDVMVVACDLPYVGADELGRLLDGARRRRDADVVVARTTRRHATCALWRSSSLPVVAAAFAAGERAVHAVLDRLTVAEVELPAVAVRNINAPADLPGYP